MENTINTILNNFTNQKVLMIGDAIVDIYFKGSSSRLSREAPVPIVDVVEKEYQAGGAANTAVNSAALTGNTTFLSIIGKDKNGEALLNLLQKNKINTKYILSVPDRNTLAKTRVLVGDQIALRFDEGTTTEAEAKTRKTFLENLEKAYANADVLVLSDYGYTVVSDKVIKKLIKLQKKNPKTIIVDSKQPQRFAKLYPTAVKPNYDETVTMLHLSKKSGAERVEQIKQNRTKLLQTTNARYVCQTLDQNGTLVLEKGKKPYHIETTPQPNTNANGAGDTFIAALSLALSSGTTGQVAAEIAAAAARVAVQKEGTTVCNLRQLQESFMNSKHIEEIKNIESKIEELKKQGKKIVFTNGCFDILHRGHVTYLEEAKSLGDILVLGINSDESIKRLKGEDRPINTLEDRIAVLAGLASVDYLVSFTENTPINLLYSIKPDIYVKGGDYTIETLPEAPVIHQLGGEVKIIPFVQGRSTTNIIKKIKAGETKENQTEVYQ